MKLRFGDNPFLKQIALKYCRGIERVTLMTLEDRIRGTVRRSVCRRSAVILIDPRKHCCTRHVIFTLLHEVRHIKLGHLVKMPVDGESQADQWALRESGLVDSRGRIREKNAICYLCIKSKSGWCLKIQFDVDDHYRDIGNEPDTCGDAAGLDV
jgi:hypothetical protein